MSDSEIKAFVLENCQISKVSLSKNFSIEVSDGIANVIGGHVQIKGKKGKLSSIPFKFGYISGVFSCDNNNFESFDFLPYECDGYGLKNNPGFKGLLYELEFVLKPKTKPWPLPTGAILGIRLYNKFIRECVENEIWYNGETNWVLMEQIFRDIKLTSYEDDKKFFSRHTKLIDIKDREIVLDFFGIDSISIDKIFSSIIKKLRSGDKDGISDFEFLRSVYKSNKKECERVFKKHGLLKDILNLFDKMPSRPTKVGTIYDTSGSLSKDDSSLEFLKRSLLSKMKRTKSEKDFESEYDTFVFIGRDSFKELPSGDYKKSLEIENLYKIDKYNHADQGAVSMMRIRSRSHPGSQLYFIHIPKGVLTEKSYTESEIPDYLVGLIDKKKTIL